MKTAGGSPFARKVFTFFAVFSVNPYPDSAGVNRLAHEYALRDHLDSAWAVRPIRLEHDQGRARLLLEFVPGELLDRLVGAPIETERFLRLAIAASAAIGRLHERGLHGFGTVGLHCGAG